MVFDFQKITSRELTYPTQKWHFEDDFPFPQVGYVNPLEGNYQPTASHNRCASSGSETPAGVAWSHAGHQDPKRPPPGKVMTGLMVVL